MTTPASTLNSSPSTPWKSSQETLDGSLWLKCRGKWKNESSSSKKRSLIESDVDPVVERHMSLDHLSGNDADTSILPYPPLERVEAFQLHSQRTKPLDNNVKTSIKVPRTTTPTPSALARVTTSAVLGMQNQIWQQIQLQRQDHYSVHQESSVRETPNRPAKTYNRLPLECSHNSINTFTRRSHRRKDLNLRLRNEAVSFNSNNKTSRTGNSVMTTTTPTESTPTIHTQPYHSSRSRSNIERKDQQHQVQTVPCFVCRNPLQVSPDAIVYCSQCHTMASAELMRTLAVNTGTSL